MPAILQVPGTARLTAPYDFGATQSWPLGTQLMTFDGRTYRYGENDGTLDVTGTLYQSEVPDANWDELAVAAAAIGATSVTVTFGATAVTADDFNGGYLLVEDDAGEGFAYVVEDTPAVSASTAGAISLAHGIEVALTASSTVITLKHPGKDVIIHPSPPTAALWGVAAAPIAANQFGWYQSKGVCAVLTEGTPIIGEAVRASETTDGTVTLQDFDEADDANAGQIGIAIAVSATGEHSPIMLDIP